MGGGARTYIAVYQVGYLGCHYYCMTLYDDVVGSRRWLRTDEEGAG